MSYEVVLGTTDPFDSRILDAAGGRYRLRYGNGWGDFDSMINTLDDALERRTWVLGKRFTAADVMLGSSVVYMRMFNMLPDTRNLGDYADRCLARPGYAIAMEKSAG